jgi:hypothetical protein
MMNTSLRIMVSVMGTSAALLIGGAAAPAAAASITYAVHVDTSALAGTQGFLDLQFLPGGADALAATASITSFNAFDTTLAATGDVTGDAAGLLPDAVTLGNSQGFNDLFQGVTFGQQFSFLLTLAGDALSPGAPPLSGTAFSLLLFGNDGFTPLLTIDPDGRIAALQIGPTGQVGVQTFARTVGAGSVATVQEVAAVPEPTTLLLVGSGIVALVAQRRRRT